MSQSVFAAMLSNIACSSALEIRLAMTVSLGLVGVQKQNAQPRVPCTLQGVTNSHRIGARPPLARVIVCYLLHRSRLNGRTCTNQPLERVAGAGGAALRAQAADDLLRAAFEGGVVEQVRKLAGGP